MERKVAMSQSKLTVLIPCFLTIAYTSENEKEDTEFFKDFVNDFLTDVVNQNQDSVYGKEIITLFSKKGVSTDYNSGGQISVHAKKVRVRIETTENKEIVVDKELNIKQAIANGCFEKL